MRTFYKLRLKNIRLKCDEGNEVVLGMRLWRVKMSRLLGGRPHIQINKQKSTSLKDLIRILSLARLVHLGNYIEFYVKCKKEVIKGLKAITNTKK